jgi:hypothetical protein
MRDATSVTAQLGFVTRASLARARREGTRVVDLRKTGSFAGASSRVASRCCAARVRCTTGSTRPR